MKHPVSIDRKLTEEQIEQIQLRAYEFYVQRGREDGHDVEDWIEAENEVLTHGTLPKSQQA